MKTEAYLFTGVAAFFAIVTAVYAFGHPEPAGTAILLISFLMASLVAVFLWVQWVRTDQRLQDSKDARVQDGSGPLDFFPPRSYYPVLTAAGAALTGLGLVYGLWLFLIGIGVLAPGVFGFAFQHNEH